MPPKRTRTAAAKAAPVPAPAKSTRVTRATRNTTGTTAVEHSSSDEDVTGGLVKTGKNKLSRPSTHRASDLMMVGGLVERTTPAKPRTKNTKISKKDEGPEKSEFDVPEDSDDAEVSRLGSGKKAPAARTAKGAQKTTRTPVKKSPKERAQESARRSTVASGSRSVLSNTSARSRARDSTSRRNEEVSPASPAHTSRANSRNISQHPATKVQSTPGAESSILALANFKRRPRQHSLLHMVQHGELEQDTMDDDTMNFSLGDGLDDFAPDDESTPLPSAKVTTTAALALQQAPSDGGDDLYRVSPQPANPRKRKSDEMEHEPEIEVIQSSPSSPLSSELDLPGDSQTIPATAPETDEEEDESEPRRQNLDSDTYADPISSSPPPTPHSYGPTTHSPAKRARPPRQAPLADTASTNRGLRTQKKPTTMSTAALRALLPRRRIHVEHSEYDIPSSSDRMSDTSENDKDQDELSRKAQSRRRAPATKSHATKPAAKKQPAKLSSAQQGLKKTYGRASAASDKENASSSSPLTTLNSSDVESGSREGTGDTSVETVAPKKRRERGDVSDELVRARNKFAEIDRWEMEFESAASLGVGAGGSSPWR